MKPRIERENRVEKAACVFAEKRGWFQVKIQKASINGFPDRLFIRNGETIYVEFKSETGRLRPEQERVIEELREQGAKVYVISSLEQASVIFR